MIIKESEMMEAAVRYASQGFKVFPCHSVRNDQCTCRQLDCEHPGKHPDTPHGLKDATSDLNRIKRFANWPNRNIAIATGPSSGIFAMDCDIKEGKDGREELRALEAQYGALPPTRESQTGSGGRHLLFRIPKGTMIPSRVNIGGLQGLDVRGEGGYIIAPPSAHISGRGYIWDPEEGIPVAYATNWLLNFLANQNAGKGTTTYKKWGSLISGTYGVGSRNSVLASVAGALLRSNIDPELVPALLLAWNSRHCMPPLHDGEVLRTFDSFRRRETARRSKQRGAK